MKLFISGANAPFNETKLSPFSAKVKKFLDASKDGELFLTRQLAQLLGYQQAATLRDARPNLPGYSHLVGAKVYWGKPGTIRQLIAETKK